MRFIPHILFLLSSRDLHFAWIKSETDFAQQSSSINIRYKRQMTQKSQRRVAFLYSQDIYALWTWCSLHILHPASRPSCNLHLPALYPCNKILRECTYIPQEFRFTFNLRCSRYNVKFNLVIRRALIKRLLLGRASAALKRDGHFSIEGGCVLVHLDKEQNNHKFTKVLLR
jgi:hypothetical protein